MVSIVDQILGLAGKLLGSLLDWPFLLFVLIVWIVARYRNEIGSMLDRRGAIKRSDLAKEVREATEPIASEVAFLRPQLAKLRSDLEKLSTSGAEAALRSDLDRVTSRTTSIETSLEKVRSSLDELSPAHLPERLQVAMEPFAQHARDLAKKLDETESALKTLFSKESAEELEKDLNRMREDVSGLSSAVTEVQSDVSRLRDVISDLADTVGLLKSQVKRVQPSDSAAARPDYVRAGEAAGDTDVPAFKVMRDALSSTRWPWRRVRKLAEMAGVSEEQAQFILEGRSDVMLRKDDWGRMIAKLTDKQ